MTRGRAGHGEIGAEVGRIAADRWPVVGVVRPQPVYRLAGQRLAVLAEQFAS
jgi:hypothetical protein